MTTTSMLFEQSQLAEAAYADFWDSETGTLISSPEGVKQRLMNQQADGTYDFSTAQATDFITHWQVVDHLPNTSTGFSGTVFRRIDDDPATGSKAGDLVFALRGTQQVGLDLFQADFNELVNNGLAFRQITDMYNYWQRLITPAGELARQAELILAPAGTPDSQIIDEGGIEWTIQLDYSSIGLGKVDLTDNLVAATGHSLGGHLATAFTRLFSGWTAEAVTFNGAGYPTGAISGLSGTALQNIPNLFALLGGDAAFPSTGITNIYGNKNIEFVAMDSFFGLQQPGEHQPMYIEQDTVYADWFGHGMGQMADSAAVFDLLVRLDGSLADASATSIVSKLNPLFEAASNDAAFSLESLIGAMGRLFTGNGLIAQDDRESLYSLIHDIRASAGYQLAEQMSDVVRIIPLTAVSGGQIATLAKADTSGGLAYRYALANLLPFAITGEPQIFSSHNANGELDLYDPATGTGALTDQYLKDRAAMLAWKMQYDTGARDDDGLADDFFRSGDKPYTAEWDSIRTPGDWDFIDQTTGMTLAIDGFDPATTANHQIVFGSAGVDTLVGDGVGDRLYGGGGDDVIDGGDGADRLEGNAGDDVLNGGDGNDTLLGGADADTLNGGTGTDELFGGAGNDIYMFSGSYGIDVITDSDGSGSINVDGQALNSATQRLEGIYRDDTTGYAFVKLNGGSSLVIAKAGEANRVIVNDWSEAMNLGLSLLGSTPAAPAATLTGDFKKAIDNHGTPDTGDDTYVVTDGNYTADGDEVDALDLISGTAGNDVIDGKGGDDALSGMAGDDYIEGGVGSDTIQGGLGQDTINGGAGNDIIYGSSDMAIDKPASVGFTKPVNDYPYSLATGFNWTAGYYDTLANGVPSGHSNAPRNRLDGDQGNLIDGGAGNDFIAAGTGADYVHGGADKDLIWGMDKDDVLFGDGDNDWIYGDGDQPAGNSIIWALPENHGNDIIDGGDGDDYLFGQGKDDIIFGGQDNDRIWGDETAAELDPAYHGNDYLDGGAGDDTLWGGDKDDTILGGADNDHLFGEAGNDTLDGGAGIDYLEGGGGNDIYLNVTGDDTVYDLEGHNSILLSTSNGLGTGGLGATVQTNNDGSQYMQLTVALDDGSALKLDSPFFSDGTTTLELASGEAFDLETLVGEQLATSVTLQNDDGGGRVYGGAGDDTLIGGAGADVLVGHNGNDILQGGVGDDTYLGVTGGDTIFDTEGNNTIVLDATGLGAGGLAASVQTNSDGVQYMQLTVALDTGDTLKLDSPFFADGTMTLQFEGGATLDLETLVSESLFTPLNLLLGDDGGRLYGGAGGDTLTGGAGNDVLIGHGGDDTLSGGGGDDVLVGGEGNDSYIFSGGRDTIVEELSVTAPNALSVNAVAADLSATQQEETDGSQTLRLSLSDGSSVDIRDGFLGAINSFTFSDSSSLSLHGLLNACATEGLILSGTGTNDRLFGGAGGDSLDGLDGVDSLYGGGGNDVLNGGGGADILLGGAGDDIYMLDATSSGDYISDQEGMNIIRFAADITPENLTASLLEVAGGSSLLLRVNGQEVATISSGVDSYRFEFTNGAQMSAAEFLVAYVTDPRTAWGDENSNVLLGGRGNDQLYGYDGNDVLQAGAGNDRLEGGFGNDDLAGGPGNDNLFGDVGSDIYRYNLGDGQDVIEEWDDPTAGHTTQDSVVFGTGIVATDVMFKHMSNGDLSVTVGGQDDALLVKGWYLDPAQRVESFVFADGDQVGSTVLESLPVSPTLGTLGNDTMLGEVGVDVLMGQSGDDLLIGNSGNDDLHGGAGSDTYRLTIGGGADQIFEESGEASFIELYGQELSRLTGTRTGDDLVLTIDGAGETMTLKDYYAQSHSWQVKDIQGTVRELEDLLAENATRNASLGEMDRLEEAFVASVKDAAIQYYIEQGLALQEDGSWQSQPHIRVTKEFFDYERLPGWSGYVPVDSTGYYFNNALSYRTGSFIQSVYSSDAAQIGSEDFWTPSPTWQLVPSKVQVAWDAQSHTGPVETVNSVTGGYQYYYSELLVILDSLQVIDPSISGISNPYIYKTTPAYTYQVTDTTLAGTVLSIAPADGTGYSFSGVDPASFFNLASLPNTLDVSLGVANLDRKLQVIEGGVGDNSIDFSGLNNADVIVHAGAGNDTITEWWSYYDDNRALVDGGSGDDLIETGAGNDWLIGGEGNDLIKGGEGTDTYVLTANSGRDVIVDDGTLRMGEASNWWFGDISNDTAVFGTGVTLADISLSLGAYIGSTDNGEDLLTTLDVSWGEGNQARIALDPGGFSPIDIYGWDGPTLPAYWEDQLFYVDGTSVSDISEVSSGFGIEQFEFANGEVVGLNELLSQIGPIISQGYFYVESAGTAAYVQSLNTHQGVLDASSSSGLTILRGSSGQFHEASARDAIHAGAGDNFILVRNLNGTDIFLQEEGRANVMSSVLAERIYDGLSYGWNDGRDTSMSRVGNDLQLNALNIELGWDEATSSWYEMGVAETINLFTIKEWFSLAGAPAVYLNGQYDLVELTQQFVDAENGLIQDGASVRLSSLNLSLAEVDWWSSGFLKEMTVGDDRDFNSLRGLSGPLENVFLFKPGVGDVGSVSASELDLLLFDDSIDTAKLTYTKSGNDLVISLGTDSVRLTDVYVGGPHVPYVSTLSGWESMTFDGLKELGATLTGSNGNDSLIAPDAYGWTLKGLAGNDTLYGGASGTPPSTTVDSLVIYAQGTPVLGVWPTMQIYVDGVLVQEFTVDGGEDGYGYIAYTVDPTKLGMAAGTIDVVFNNDAWRPELGEDRNLYVEKIMVNGRTMNPTDYGVFYDLGGGAAAFDGSNLRLGQETVNYNGALRFTLGNSDTLDGGFGSDEMTGGSGNDTYLVDNIGDVVTEISDDGTDTVRSSLTYNLGANIENLVLTGTVAVSGTGNALNNFLIGNINNNTLHGDAGADTLIGNAGNDWLDGGAGSDIMQGGQGNDTYVVESAGDRIVERANEGSMDRVESSISFTLGVDLENLTLTGDAPIHGAGNELDNTLIGNGASNTLTAGLGNDFLDGGEGADGMVGGMGDDNYVVDALADAVTENEGEGRDTVQLNVAGDYTLAANLENVYRYGDGSWTTTGNSENNSIGGNAANDTLIGLAGDDWLGGGLGADTLIGGMGDDSYYVDDAGDVVTEVANEGTDMVYTFGTLAYTLAANVENGSRALWAGSLTGNALNNSLEGSWGNDMLDGGAGVDTLTGWGGDDTLVGGLDNDTYILGRDYGADTVIENDTTAGNTDVAQFLAGVATDQIWFQQVDNNLEASIIGTGDKLVIQDWYLGADRHVEQFQTTDGAMTLVDSNVQNLVNAMASFAPPAAGQTSLPQNYQDALAGVIAANWQ